MKTRELGLLTRVFRVGLVVQLAMDALFIALALGGGATLLLAPALWNLACVPLLLLTGLHLALGRRESQRAAAVARMPAERALQLQSASIFGRDYEDVLLDRQRSFLEKWLGPLLSGLSLLLLAGLALGLGRGWPGDVGPWPGRILASLLAFRACAGFVLARYTLGISRAAGHGHLAAVGGLGLWQALFCLTLALWALADEAGLEAAAPLTGLPAQACILAYVVEVLVRALLRLYGAGDRAYPVTCSWLARPGPGLQRRVRQALEYHFGEAPRKVLRDPLWRGGVPMLLLFMSVLLGASCLSVVPEGSVGFRETLGCVSTISMGPGLRIKPPWPWGRLHLVDVALVRELRLGSAEEAGTWDSPGHGAGDVAYLCVDSRPGARDLPLDSYAAGALLHYTIANPAAYITAHGDPDGVVAIEAERMLSHAMLEAGASGDPLAADHGAMGRAIGAGLQLRLDELRLGVRVERFAILQVHPPHQTLEAFSGSLAARFERDKALLDAAARAAELTAQMAGERHERLARAGAAAETLVAEANARRDSIALLGPVQAVAGPLFTERKALEALGRALRHMQKVIVLNRPGSETDELNMEQPLDIDGLSKLTIDAMEEKNGK